MFESVEGIYHWRAGIGAGISDSVERLMVYGSFCGTAWPFDGAQDGAVNWVVRLVGECRYFVLLRDPESSSG